MFHRVMLSVPLLIANVGTAQAAAAKATICHPTGSGSVLTLEVASSAVPAHLKHGDYYPRTWYTDADGDGYGDDASTTVACVAPDGTSGTGGDMDDDDPSVYPGALDVCDGTDNDGDGSTDEDALSGATLLSRVDSELVTLDPLDGTITTQVALSGDGVDFTGINALSSDLVTGLTYGLDKVDDRLVRIDTCSGEVDVVGSTGAGNVCGVAFGPDGLLYGLDSTNDTLVTLDTGTGAATVVGSLGFNLIHCGLAYDCATDTLYGVHINKSSRAPDWIFSVDPSSGLATKVVDLDPSVAWNQAGIESDVSNGYFYVGMAEGLYAVDATTGLAELVVAGALDSLSWYNPEVCE